MADFFALTLLPASFRGVPFETEGDRFIGGRRGPDHEYPYRDVPWAEDLGRHAKRYPVTGFVIGDDATAQEQALIAACDKSAGPGLLVHPRYGNVMVVCRHIETETRFDAQRVVEFRLDFVEAGQLQYPVDAGDTRAAVKAAADRASASANAAYIKAWGQFPN
jgi:prophage DNA circulation protein